MELKLNVYRRNPETKKREVVKTVESNTVFLPYGIVEDIIHCVDLEALNGEMDKKEMLSKIGPAILSGMQEITPLLLDTFEDLTEDDLRNCNTADIAAVIIDILIFAVKNMFAKKSKNR